MSVMSSSVWRAWISFCASRILDKWPQRALPVFLLSACIINLTSFHSKLKEKCACCVASGMARRLCWDLHLSARGELGRRGRRCAGQLWYLRRTIKSIIGQIYSTIAWPSCNAPSKGCLFVSQQTPKSQTLAVQQKLCDQSPRIT